MGRGHLRLEKNGLQLYVSARRLKGHSEGEDGGDGLGRKRRERDRLGG